LDASDSPLNVHVHLLQRGPVNKLVRRDSSGTAHLFSREGCGMIGEKIFQFMTFGLHEYCWFFGHTFGVQDLYLSCTSKASRQF